MIARTDPWFAPPRISRQQFERVMVRRGSPWATNAERYYELIVLLGADPAVYLGVAVEEHQILTDPGAVALIMGTLSWTNARSVQTGNLGPTRIVSTADLRRAGIADRDGPYVAYSSVEDSLRDGIERVRKKGYAYEREFGSNPSIEQVLSVWTESGGERYTVSLVENVNAWIAEDQGMGAQIPGFAWEPADERHYTPGRTQAISGFAVHYTGRPTPGGSSLNWLTKHPNSNVSATFLIKYEPTLEDRGWQLVRIEDTPHTTGTPVNAFTVSFEFELMNGQPISAMAYQVMAQTILDAAAYVTEHGLGNIPITREAIKGHREWTGSGSTICPDGIEVDRIVEIAQNGVVDGARLFPETGFAIRGRMRAKWESLERIGEALPVVGYPISEEYDYEHEGKSVVRQDFERLSLIFAKEQLHPWDVTALFTADAYSGVDILTLERIVAHAQAIVNEATTLQSVEASA